MSERRLDPRNLTAQLRYRGEGNPPNSEPDSAPSNCYPGVEVDFRNAWSRLFEGIVLHEANNYVVHGEGELARLVGRRLLRVDGQPTMAHAWGPGPDGEEGPLTAIGNPEGAWTMEWSNLLAAVLARRGGELVRCEFTRGEAWKPLGVPADPGEMEAIELRLRPLFAWSDAASAPLAVIDEDLAPPGELGSSLCSPWQRDFRGCFCYYWAATRPDFVNTQLRDDGSTTGDNWIAKERHGEYLRDAGEADDPRHHSYDDLNDGWERLLRFVVGGGEIE